MTKQANTTQQNHVLVALKKIMNQSAPDCIDESYALGWLYEAVKANYKRNNPNQDDADYRKAIKTLCDGLDY